MFRRGRTRSCEVPRGRQRSHEVLQVPVRSVEVQLGSGEIPRGAKRPLEVPTGQAISRELTWSCIVGPGPARLAEVGRGPAGSSEVP